MHEHEPPFETEELLSAFRQGSGPSATVEKRILDSLHAQLPLAPPSAPAELAAAQATARASAGGLKVATSLKIAAVILGLGGAVIATLAGRSPDGGELEGQRVGQPSVQASAQPFDDRDRPPQASAPPRLRPPPPPLPESTEAEAEARSAASSEDAPATRAARSRARRARPDPVKDEPTPGSGDSNAGLADEAKLLRSADAALRARDFAGAGASLDEHAATFPRGALTDQAEILRLLLACAQRAPGTIEAARTFLELHPKARARARIEDTCELP